MDVFSSAAALSFFSLSGWQARDRMRGGDALQGKEVSAMLRGKMQGESNRLSGKGANKE